MAEYFTVVANFLTMQELGGAPVACVWACGVHADRARF